MKTEVKERKAIINEVYEKQQNPLTLIHILEAI